jgi:hypothetical protein
MGDILCVEPDAHARAVTRRTNEKVMIRQAELALFWTQRHARAAYAKRQMLAPHPID